MGEMVVKDNVRYTKKDAARADVVTAGNAVTTKVPVQDADAWAQAQADAARAELQAELDQMRGEIAKLREADASGGEGDPATPPPGDEAATKVTDPEVTKVREPSTTKSRASGSK